MLSLACVIINIQHDAIDNNKKEEQKTKQNYFKINLINK